MKNKQNYKVIGIMSGTSLDGLDLAYCEFTLVGNEWTFHLIQAKNEVYPGSLLQKLQQSTETSGLDLTVLDVDLGRFIGEKVKQFIRINNFEVDLIASHGHTVFHQTSKGITKQIGNGNIIAAITGVPVIYDFRSLDVALGGQGAPLVPIGDQLLFHDYDYCLNLGGIANISFQKNKQRVAYDICPCNMVLNYVANQLNEDFDRDGAIAARGKVIEPLLQKLNSLGFYKEPYPKSLGFEWVKAHVFPLMEEHLGRPEDLMCTLAEHISIQITKSIQPAENARQKLLITGGGAFNQSLVNRLKEQVLQKVEVCIPEAAIINYKEAIVFGFLGILRARSEVNCLSTVTGASRDNSGGVIAGSFEKMF